VSNINKKINKMVIASSILFRIGCAGMASVIGMGAAFGHAGRLS